MRDASLLDQPAPGWRAHLVLPFQRVNERTLGAPRHQGPLRVLKSLYPEGDAICHQVIVHPPGGIVGGDDLHIDIDVAAGAHAVLTTPGATRFYRSRQREAAQRTQAVVREGARLEWLPLETIVHSGAQAVNSATFKLERGASMIGWDITCLGLPASGETFVAGRLRQHLEIQGRWLERAVVDAQDQRLLHSPLGLSGRPVVATAWVAWDGRADGLTDVIGQELAATARRVLQADDRGERQPLNGRSGDRELNRQRAPIGQRDLDGQRELMAVSSLQPGLLVARALAWRVEPVSAAWRALRNAWRTALWGVPLCEPRVWGH